MIRSVRFLIRCTPTPQYLVYRFFHVQGQILTVINATVAHFKSGLSLCFFHSYSQVFVFRLSCALFCFTLEINQVLLEISASGSYHHHAITQRVSEVEVKIMLTESCLGVCLCHHRAEKSHQLQATVKTREEIF